MLCETPAGKLCFLLSVSKKTEATICHDNSCRRQEEQTEPSIVQPAKRCKQLYNCGRVCVSPLGRIKTSRTFMIMVGFATIFRNCSIKKSDFVEIFFCFGNVVVTPKMVEHIFFEAQTRCLEKERKTEEKTRRREKTN